ncbi:MAG: inorganic diphosphatase [Candidatus Hydrothermarchaeales archaeon]
MLVVVETPKWSFTKLEFTSEGYKKALTSPIPTPFNYGFIEGTLGEDGMPLDVVILGKKHPPGSKLDLKIIGKVGFIDDGRVDDKFIATLDGNRHEMAIRIFFTVYTVAKLVMGLLKLRRWTKNKFTGVEWFDVEVSHVDAL